MKRRSIRYVVLSCLIYTNAIFAQDEEPITCDAEVFAEKEQTFVQMAIERAENPETTEFTEREYQLAALDYVEYAAICYQGPINQTGEPVMIDDGALTPDFVGQSLSRSFIFPNFTYGLTKWGADKTTGTSGGTVTYSFIGDNVDLTDSLHSTSNGNNVNAQIESLNNYSLCFKAKIVAGFAAWSAVSNIQFLEVSDNGLPANDSGASGTIRIGTHPFDGPIGTLAHAYNPSPTTNADFPAAGDIHFDTAENWTCDASGFDIGAAAIHEIGHAIGLNHVNIRDSVMFPIHNNSSLSLFQDDIDGAIFIYGPPRLPPTDINIAPVLSILLFDEDEQESE